MRELSFLTAALCGAAILLSQGCAPTCESVCARQDVECANIAGDSCVDECSADQDLAEAAGCGDLIDALVACINVSPNICMPSCDAESQAVLNCVEGADTRTPPMGTVDAGPTTVDAGPGGLDSGTGSVDAGLGVDAGS